jgi:tetratricopeptide (TPR) repeat protein
LEIIKICSQTKGADNLKIRAFCELFRLYFQQGNIDISLNYLEKAQKLVFNSKNQKWFLALKVWLYAYYYHQYYINHYVLKKEIQRLFHIYNEILGDCELMDYDIKHKLYFACCIIKDLAVVYNRLQQYDNALKCVHDFSTKFNQLEGINAQMLKCSLDVEQGYALLRTNKLEEANSILTDILENRKQFVEKDANKMFDAFVYRSEINIRLEKFQDSFRDCEKAIKSIGSSITNFATLMKIICYYNMAVVCYKQKKYIESMKYFNIMLEISNKFCSHFIEKDEFQFFVKQHIFCGIDDIIDLEKCQKKSLQIFSVIYGKEHSFVKNYIEKNSLP